MLQIPETSLERDQNAGWLLGEEKTIQIQCGGKAWGEALFGVCLPPSGNQLSPELDRYF